MALKWDEIQANAVAFSKRWQNATREEALAQSFEKEFLAVFATLFHFGVLTSNVHMAWMRTVAGRLKSDYRYSKELVYNTFPWPDVTEEQIAVIEKAAQGVLDERKKYPGTSLADLYDPTLMKTTGMLKAHQNLDRAVMRAYGYSVKDTTEASCVADLMERYQRLIVNAKR